MPTQARFTIMKGLQNAVVNMPRRYLITLLTLLVITLLFAGHYSYNNPEDCKFGVIFPAPR